MHGSVRESPEIRVLHGAVVGAELLWQGEGWFINNQDICQAYEVYSFRASHDGARVQILLDREVIFDASSGVAVECEPEAFGQEPVEIVHLLRPEPSTGDSDSGEPAS